MHSSQNVDSDQLGYVQKGNGESQGASSDFKNNGDSDTQVCLADCLENTDDCLSERDTKDMCASILAKLQCSNMANSLVSTIVSDLEELISEVHTQTHQKILSVIPLDNLVRTAVESSFTHFENPFVCFNTENKRANYFLDKWGIVEPIEIRLGMRYDMRHNKKTGSYDQIPVKDIFVYVPILETIKFMCQNSDICRLIRESSERQRSHDYMDFCDGSYFKAHPLFSRHSTALQIQLYYDDFKTANPLGSKHGIHKIGALYF